jgi:hypothetical protein
MLRLSECALKSNDTFSGVVLQAQGHGQARFRVGEGETDGIEAKTLVRCAAVERVAAYR